MKVSVLGGGLLITQLMLAVAMVIVTARVVRGPRAQDRILALDTLYTLALLLILTFGMRTGSTLYFEVALIISLLGFASTVALSKFLMRGEVIE